jgi:hypothetical protein
MAREVRLSVRCSVEQRAALRRHADSLGVSATDAVRAWLDDLADGKRKRARRSGPMSREDRRAALERKMRTSPNAATARELRAMEHEDAADRGAPAEVLAYYRGDAA